ncbi:hypothetical protein [Tsukamurella pseudospumae]|uniref:PE domain-containing protein n=1 Tax=Tsukamurella pseudospumae TaxID=239498 RepID=A0A138AWB6_9ACTN|nr:hypothetical protein [Tsukamurella pseudospumae]KXP14699.1 hypothetical protein AXK60_02075 [Tsukamurella pseudospumae]
MTDEPTKADIAKLRECLNELRAVAGQLAGLTVPAVASTADSRATRIADAAYSKSQADFQQALAKAAPVLSEQADVIEKWLTTTEAIQSDTAKKSGQLGKDLKDIPTPSNKPTTPKTIAGGDVHPDGTVEL